VPLILQGLTARAAAAGGGGAHGIVTFILFEAAYFCEIMRAGIQSIRKVRLTRPTRWAELWPGHAPGDPSAGLSQHACPILLTQTIVLFQDTSLVYVISATDFVGAAAKVAQRDSRLVEMYLFVAVVYFLLCYTLSTLVRQLQSGSP